MRTLAKWICACAAAAGLAAAGWSQQPQSAIRGRVTNELGQPIPGAGVVASARHPPVQVRTVSNAAGEFQLTGLAPGTYQVTVSRVGWKQVIYSNLRLRIGQQLRLSAVLAPSTLNQTLTVRATPAGTALDTSPGVEQTSIGRTRIRDLPLAHRSFANLAWITPMTEPVEPSDPTKARITAVSFAGSSGLNVNLSVDGGDNNDDYIGGFLQAWSPAAIDQFVVRTSNYGAAVSRSNGASVAIETRRGGLHWHGGAGLRLRATALNARNPLDNPPPGPKQPYSSQDGALAAGGPLRPHWFFFGALEALHENASVAYPANSLLQFRALAQLAAAGQIPGVSSIAVPAYTPIPFHDLLWDTRLDWQPSTRAHWFLRLAGDENRTRNQLVQPGSLPSTGADNPNHYFNALLSQRQNWDPDITGVFTAAASLFDLRQLPNSHLGLTLAFPFSSSVSAYGFETFGDNQFVTPEANFPVYRKQQKYQFRYDLNYLRNTHQVRWGVDFIHEPVLSGRLANALTRLVIFPQDPSWYLANGQSIRPLIESTPYTGGGNGGWTQNVQRLGVYAGDMWQVDHNLLLSYGLRYDTSFGLFQAEGRSQTANPAWQALHALGSPLAAGVPHDYRGAVAPRLGLAFAPGKSGRTVIRAGAGLVYSDLLQNGWVQAFQAVNAPGQPPLSAGEQGYLIDPFYHAPYVFQTSAAVEHAFGKNWQLTLQFQHQQGNHAYRRYEYAAGVSLPANDPNVSVFRSDNRSSYSGLGLSLRRVFAGHYELTANYTLAKAQTWGCVMGELFDYVNGVCNVHDAFGPGDYGPSGEDVRHRLVLSGIWSPGGGWEFATLSQFESARPYTLTTPADVNHNGVAGEARAVVNGIPTTLDEFRGRPFMQVDLRASREWKLGERFRLRPYIEFFNLLNRANAGNNFITNLAALPLPVNNLANATAFCLNAACSQTEPISSLQQLRYPAGALGDTFGPGTTVGMPFAAQLGLQLRF